VIASRRVIRFSLMADQWSRRGLSFCATVHRATPDRPARVDEHA